MVCVSWVRLGRGAECPHKNTRTPPGVEASGSRREEAVSGSAGSHLVLCCFVHTAARSVRGVFSDTLGFCFGEHLHGYRLKQLESILVTPVLQYVGGDEAQRAIS